MPGHGVAGHRIKLGEVDDCGGSRYVPFSCFGTPRPPKVEIIRQIWGKDEVRTSVLVS